MSEMIAVKVGEAIDFTLTYPYRVARLALVAPAVSGAPAPGSLPPGVAELDQQMDAAVGAGDIDRIIERCHYLRQAIPGARGVEITGTAHLPNPEQPHRVNSLLRAFLS